MQVHINIIIDINLPNSHCIPSILGSGTAMMAHMKLLERERLPEPFGHCITSSKADYRDLSDGELSHSGATNTGACVQRQVADKCGCLHPDIALVPDDHLGKAYCGFHSNCSSRHTGRGSVDQSSCYSIAREDIACAILAFADNMQTCFLDNYLECLKIHMEMRYSYTKFPHTEQKPAFVQEYIKNREFQGEYTDLINSYNLFVNGSVERKRMATLNNFAKSDDIEQNFMKVDFRMSEFTIHHVKDRSKYTPTNVLSAFGGISNIYSGITAIIVVELTDMMVRICVRKMGNKNEKIDMHKDLEQTGTSL